MKIQQMVWTNAKGWSIQNEPGMETNAQLVVIFAATEILKEKTFFEEIKKMYPQAHLFGCSTAGKISPFTSGAPCALHNQTMTITTFAEV